MTQERSKEGRRDSERLVGDRRMSPSLGHDPERRIEDQRSASERRLGESRKG
ncbi:MAG TPA: hypothetical protein VGK15_07985 [Candidatus Limnocylindria bacterium]|jgi:hypothetical protein